MQRNHSTIRVRKSSLIMATMILLFSLSFSGTLPAARAQEITSTTCTLNANPDGSDSCEADNSVADLEAGLLAGNDQLLSPGVAQTHSIAPADDVDYVKFHLDVPSSIVLDITGPDTGSIYTDTEMFLYDSSDSLLDYNNDKSIVNFYSYIQRCGSGVYGALPAGDYYVKVDKRSSSGQPTDVITSYDITLTTNTDTAACVPNVDVVIAGTLRKSYWLHPDTASFGSFGLNAGPVQVSARDGESWLAASVGLSLKKTANYESYSEVIGIPAGQATNIYWFPWYVNGSSGLVSQLCFANASTTSTAHVRVKIGTSIDSPYTLGVNRAKCTGYAGINDGPVSVQSTDDPSVPIVASMFTRMRNNATFTSYGEFGGLAANSTRTDYMFPWYTDDPTTLTWVRFTNVGAGDTTVTLTIHGTPQAPTYDLAAGAMQTVLLPSGSDGPVHVVSDREPIAASMLTKLKSTARFTSYQEMIGLPEASPLTQTRFIFPWYTNAGNLFSQLRITNIGNTKTNITVTIGTTTKRTFTDVGPRQTRTTSFASFSGGPVVVQSSGGVPIVASKISYLKKGYAFTSYSEYMGQSGAYQTQLMPMAWFPWYSNLSGGTLASQLRFAMPVAP